DESSHDCREGKGIHADVPHLADRLPRVGARLSEPSADVAHEIAALADPRKHIRDGVDQVLTRAKRISPTTPKMIQGSHAARYGGIIPPTAFIICTSMTKITVVPSEIPTPYAAPP